VTARPFRVERLSAAHDRAAFDCGVAALNTYLATHASQDEKRRVASCFIAVDTATSKVAGFYTLSAASVDLSDIPAATAKTLPRYPAVPAIRLGRLAVAIASRGQGLGAALLWDAMERAARVEIGAFALLVDAKDEGAARFYAQHGFVAFADRPLLLFRPIKGA
jgi:GNAT superfamily N-acetyltransferase